MYPLNYILRGNKKYTIFGFEYWVLRKWLRKMLLVHFVKRLALQNTNANCFVVINNRVMVLNLKSVVPIKTHCVHGKQDSALHTCLLLMSLSKTTSLFDQKLPTNGFKLNSKFYLSQIISL